MTESLKFVSDIAFTPAVKAWQEKEGSRKGYASMEAKGGWRNTITADLINFIKQRNSFYLGTATADGQPYIQHRGGDKGFLKVIDSTTLGFADYRGNRQYISAGNQSENSKAFIFLMDYQNATRVKIWGELKVVEGDQVLEKSLTDDGYETVVERVMLFTVKAWDVNCPKYIPQFVDNA